MSPSTNFRSRKFLIANPYRRRAHAHRSGVGQMSWALGVSLAFKRANLLQVAKMEISPLRKKKEYINTNHQATW